MAKKCSFKLLFNITGLIVSLVLLFLIGYYIVDSLNTKESLEPRNKCGIYDYAGIGGEKNWPPVSFKSLPEGVTCANVGGKGHGSNMTSSPESCAQEFFKNKPKSKQGVFVFENLPTTSAESQIDYHNCYWNDISTCYMTPGLAKTWRGSNLTTTGYYTPGVQSTGGQSCDRPGVTLLNSENVGQAGCRGLGHNRFQKQDGTQSYADLTINVPVVQTGAFKHSWSGACENECNKADCYGYLFDNSEINALGETADQADNNLDKLSRNNCFIYGPASYLNTNTFDSTSICSVTYNPSPCVQGSFGSTPIPKVNRMLKYGFAPDTLQNTRLDCMNHCKATNGCVSYKYFNNYPAGNPPWDMGAPLSNYDNEKTLCRLYSDNAGSSDKNIWPASDTCALTGKYGNPLDPNLNMAISGDQEANQQQKM
tara:strand:- start:2 stop:1273 length:1272 start_codon:yes stop_codon:yes gene_type:complete